MSERYARQLALPEISASNQQALLDTKILVVGAGGLGGASLPYLAAAGVGEIHIADHDRVSISNLHRQTIYKDAQEGENKATCASAYLNGLNPDIRVRAITEKITHNTQLDTYDLILDGSDNFETKSLLNEISIKTRTPLITASVNKWQGQIGIFAGYAEDRPCYQCMFPELPNDARNCNEAGILGTSAGQAGLTQAHIALEFLIGLHDREPGFFLSVDYAAMRMQKLHVPKNKSCKCCADQKNKWEKAMFENNEPKMISHEDLLQKDHLIIDVREPHEVNVDPIGGDVLHMPLQQVPARINELEAEERLLAFVCAGNVRSVKAAEYCAARGINNVIVLDKFSL